MSDAPHPPPAEAKEPPRFPFLAVDAPAELADELAGELMFLGAAGVEIQDDSTFTKGPGGGLVRLVASVASTEEGEQLRAALARPDLDAEVGELVGDGWRDAYKEHFKPFAITASLVVVPPWESYAPKDGEQVLTLDPGRAFGTGLHATTALVAQELDRLRDQLAGQPLLDVGTGSGILALAALTLGASSARAVDNDPDVVEVVRENAERCGLAERIEVDAAPVETLTETYPLVVANIRSTVLLPMAPALVARCASGATLVLSGVLASEQEEVTAAYLAQGMEHLRTAQSGQPSDPDRWVALVFRKP